MYQTICFDVLCLENVLLIHAFSGPQPPVRAADFGTKCLLWHHLYSDLSYNAVGPIFRIFIHNGSVKKAAKFQLCT